MRPQRLLRASSTQNVCAFCACRLTGQAPPTAATTPLALQQRTFSNSRRQDNSSSPWSGFDPNSSLSLSEQKEKAARIARRQEAEAAQAAAEAAERQRRAEEKRRQDEALTARKQEMQKARAGQWSAQSGRQQQTHRRQAGGQNGARGDSVVRKHNVRGGDVFAQTNSHKRQQHNARDRPGSLPRPSRLSKEKEKPAPPEPLPSFMQAPSTSEPEKKQPQGWGVGRVEPKSLEYGEFEAELERDDPAPAKSAFGNQKEDSVNTRSELAPEPQQRPTPGFGFGRRADFKPRPTQSAQSNDESIHDIFGSGRGPEPQTSPTTYRPALQGEAQSEAQPSRMRSQPFSRDQSRFNPALDESTEYDNWQHLGQRQSRVPQPQAEQNQSSPFDDESWIDRSFAEHREARDSRFRSARANPTLQSAARRRGQRENDVEHESVRRTPTCGRCGQQGHIARECSSPVTAKCHFCGQIGHMASRCPSSDRAQQSRDSRGSETSYSDPRRQMLERMRPSRNEETSGRENAFEERAERAIKSRKFRDDEPRKDKGSRRGRRDLDEYAGRDERKGSRRDRGFEDEEDDDYSVRYSKKEAKAEKEAKEAEKKARRAAERAAKQAEQKGQIKLPEFISVQNLAQALGVRYEQFVNRLEDLGYDDVFPGKVFNSEVSGMIAMEYDLEPVIDTTARDDEEFDLKARPEVAAEDKEMLPTRPPVVTIMGHVDHGKTTILDYLRKSSVVAGEAGGITQHIGAFSVPLSASGKTITFLDTPGHAAFLAMRQRGANVTDIVILVIAADDSVKPQTLEAIKHARGAGVPMLVAVNKVDKESADVQRVKQDLARHGVEIEDFGGDTQVVEVSGKTGKGMDELEEATVTLSEILDHRADTEGAVEGWVIEATTKKSGRVATVLVRRGTLRQGAVIVAGNTWARVRTLHNEAGVAIDEAGPGMPVEVDGWREQPVAGDEVLQAPSEQKATSVVDYRLVKAEREKTAEDMEVINEARRVERERREREKAAAEQAKLRAKGEDGEFAEETSPAEESTNASGIVEVPFIIKADVSGSAEAVEAYVMSISSPMVMPRILYAAVGQIHESDVELAATTKGHIIAFNLPSNEGMKGMATSNGVKVLENNIIYRVIDDVKSVLEEKLPPIITQRVVGEAEVAMPFEISLGGRKKMKIAGCKVRNGLIGFGSRVRVMRGEEKIYDGTLSSLKNVKKDVQEMRKGTECGMGFDGWEGFEAGDTIQTYEEKSEKRTL